jgi:hypothetical protein
MNLVTRILLALAIFAIPTAVAAAELSTGTDAHRDINGAQVDKMRGVKGVRYHLADGAIVLLMPNDEWAVNHTGEGLEFLSDERQARLGVEAHLAGSDWSPANALQATVDNLKKAHGGTWTAPEHTNVAGIPALKASGTDVFGNYYFEIYGVERAGIQFLVWMRTPYQNRWNTRLNADVAWVINNLHPSTRTVMQKLDK